MSFKTSRKNKRNSAFTLVELVIVIAVIAVLSAILVPTFSGIINNSKKAKLEANLKTISSELVTRSLKENVSYFTPGAVKNVAFQLGFDFTADDFFVPDGYSVWYDQKNFNLRLIPDTETLKAEGSSLSVYTPGAVFGYGIGSSSIDNLSRRPEALLQDKNLLILATNQKNKPVLNAVEQIYLLGNQPNVDAIDGALNNILNGITSLVSSDVITNCLDAFSTKNTLYVNDAGYITTLTEGYTVQNIVVSPAAIAIVGIVGQGDNQEENNTLAYNYDFNCVFEIPESVEEVKGSAWNMVGNNGVEVITLNSNTTVADSTIRNVTITNANSGGAFSENSYVPTNIIKLDEGVHYGIDYDTYTTEWMNGYTKSNTLADSSKIAEYLATPGDATTDKDGKTYAVKAKYIAPSIWFKLSEIKALLANLNASSSEEVQAIKSIDKITVYESTYGDYRMLTILAIYTDAKDFVRGARLGNSIGYVTNIYEYARNEGKEIAIESAGATDNAGYIKVKLPVGAKNLKDYNPANLTVTAYYKQVTTYYQKTISSFGNEYYSKVGVTVSESEEHCDLTSYDATENSWKLENISFAKLDGSFEGATHFKNSTQLTKVEIKDTATGRVLYVKYYN